MMFDSLTFIMRRRTKTKMGKRRPTNENAKSKRSSLLKEYGSESYRKVVHNENWTKGL